MRNLPEFDQHSTSHNERLARAFFSVGRFSPHFLGVTGLGFLAIYVLTRSGVFGQPSPSLAFIGVLTILLAAAQIPLLGLARRNKGIAVTVWGTVTTSIFAIFLVYFWQGIVPISIAIALIVPASAIRAGISRRYYPLLSFIFLLTIAGILYVDSLSTFERMQNGTPASIASLVFLLSAGLLLAAITILSENRNFKKLQTLLLASFIVIVTIPTVMAAILSATGTFTSSQAQTFNTLRAISSLKENQLAALIRQYRGDAGILQNDREFARSAVDFITTRDPESPSSQAVKRLARDRAASLLGSGQEYREIMVLNNQGEVLISTSPQNEGLNVENQVFFRQGTLRPYIGFANVDRYGNENLIVAAPLFEPDGRVIRGVLALRSDARLIKDVMEITPGFETAETYLVDRNFKPVTNTRTSVGTVSTRASLEAILNNTAGEQAVYENYEKQAVLGYYAWFEPMQVAIISEIPLNAVVATSAKPLIGSAVLALLIISMAIAAVAISAHSIVHPIRLLAETTESFAAGKLSARAPIEREDEIGALARSYNQMAAQLQEIIGRLEQRVNDRTRDLENQTRRLRIASEIARDVASARDMGALLDRSTQLISARFLVHHAGIYLLDRNKEHAVLASSSSQEGKRMVRDHFRLRLGEGGMVGRVATTGEPRLLHEADKGDNLQDKAYLSATRTRMTLPLKTEDNVIGVLDIQSEESLAFGEDDLAIMQTMADQIATAIERTRLLQDVESNYRELENAYGRYTREAWNRLIDGRQTGMNGYRFDNIRMEPVTELSELEARALESGTKSRSIPAEGDQEARVAIPVKLRGQMIGVISVRLKEDHGSETVSTVELAAERLASALESARLYEEARLRADREQAISQVATAISSSTTYEDILQTTVREIGLALQDVEVSIQITGEAEVPH